MRRTQDSTTVKSLEAPLRITFLNYMDPLSPRAGGAEKYCFEIARRLVRDGNDVYWISSGRESRKRLDEIEGIRICHSGSLVTTYAAASLQLRSIRETDLVIESANGSPYLTPITTRLPTITIVYHLVPLRVMATKLGLLSIVPYAFQRTLLPVLYRNRRVVTISGSSRTELQRLGLRDVSVVYCGVDAREPSSQKKERLAVILGPLKPWKGVEDAIRAFSRLPDSWRLAVLGYFESPLYERRVRHLVDLLGMRARVEFCGYVSEKTKFDYLERAQLNISCSLKEGWGIGIIEAAVSRCVTVGYEVPGTKDAVIQGETGLLVPGGDVDALGDVMAQLVDDPGLVRKLGDGAIVWSRKFTWESTYAGFRDLIQTIVGAHDPVVSPNR